MRESTQAGVDEDAIRRYWSQACKRNNNQKASQPMALEDEIKGLRSDIQALTAQLAGGKAPAAAGSKAADKKAAAPTKTAEEVTEMAVRVKKEKGTDAAKALIKAHGKADELKNVKPENYDALFAACEAALAEEDPGDGI